MRLTADIRKLVADALAEDIGKGDATTAAIGVKGTPGKAFVLAKSDGVLFGCDIFADVFRQLDQKLKIKWRIKEGKPYKARTKLATLNADTAALLTGERTSLNFLAHLSGIATYTRQFVNAVKGTGAGVLDTRKTHPGWRKLQKAAVKAGGGVNHRMGLDDAVMIKNNHITVCGGIEAALQGVMAGKRKSRKKIPIICETRTMREVRLAVNYGVDWILLDHFGPARLRKVVAEIRKIEKQTGRRIVLESSGGINLKNIRAKAASGVDYLSVGALTQSAPAVDLSLRLE